MVKTKGKSDVIVSKVYLTRGGTMFSEADLKAYEMPQSQQLEQNVEWATNIIKPPYDLAKLMEWTNLSVIHNSCIRAKVQDSVGVGYLLTEVEGEKGNESDYEKLNDFFHKCNEGEDIVAVCKKVMFDYESCGNGYFEVVRGVTDEEGIKAIYHVNALTIRLAKTKDKWIQMIGQKKVYFKMWGDERILNKDTGNFVKQVDPEQVANELIQMKMYTYKSSYYGLPEWLPAIFQMFGELKEKEYNLDFFTNFGIPAYAVVLEGAELNVETREEIQKYFETEIKNNPHRTMVFSTPQGAKVRFEKLAVEQKDASFRVYRKDNRDDILTAHHVPPYRAAIVEKGQLGGTVAEDVDRIYLDSVINPRQNVFTWILTELIIWEGFGITSFEFMFEDVDIRDKKNQAEIDEKYVQLGIRTPNEVRIEQGLEPYEGGDAFYVPANFVPIGISEENKSKRKVEISKGVTCQGCKKMVSWGEAEKNRGWVKCPHCEKLIDHEGVVGEYDSNSE